MLFFLTMVSASPMSAFGHQVGALRRLQGAWTTYEAPKHDGLKSITLECLSEGGMVLLGLHLVERQQTEVGRTSSRRRGPPIGSEKTGASSCSCEEKSRNRRSAGGRIMKRAQRHRTCDVIQWCVLLHSLQLPGIEAKMST